MKSFLKILPWLFVALFGAEIIAVLMPKSDGALRVPEFGRLPVLLNGRIQPFDSVAHNALLQMRSTSEVPLEFVTNKLGFVTEFPGWKFWHHPKKLKSSEWLLEVFFKPEVADTRPIFLIHHPDLISELKLGEKGIERSSLRYYTFNELKSEIPEISEQARRADGVAAAQRTTYQKQLLKLANAMAIYRALKNSIEPEGTGDFAKLTADYQASLPAGLAAFRAQQAGQPADQAALDRFTGAARMFDEQASLAYPLAVPPLDPDHDRDDWSNVGASLLGTIRTGELHPAIGYFSRIAGAYSGNNNAEFNSAVAGYKNWLGPKFSGELTKGRAEFYFNRIKIFLHAMIIYLMAFVLAGAALLTFGGWPGLSEAFRRSAFYLIVLAFVVHTFGLIFRMALEGRPPVTNLYSSAIFIGWGACVLGLLLERIYRNSIGCVVAGLAGFLTLVIAHNLALGGDTMEMLQAVLDTNFWLATHVVIVTLGYASTFVAGLLAILYIVLGLFTRNLTMPMSAHAATAARTAGAQSKTAAVSQRDELGKTLARMVYAIICFAALFSFTGTVLGGIWADQSWGRFWGWDVKENGALLIVIWNALILHARWGGVVRERGIMILAVVGNIMTSFSWFGVNMLGIGLHSYGFMEAAFKWLMLFIGIQLAVIGLGCVPLDRWRSFRKAAASETSGPGNGGRGAPAPVTT